MKTFLYLLIAAIMGAAGLALIAIGASTIVWMWEMAPLYSGTGLLAAIFLVAIGAAAMVIAWHGWNDTLEERHYEIYKRDNSVDVVSPPDRRRHRSGMARSYRA